MSRRIRAGAAGVCAAAVVCFGTWQGWSWYLVAIAAAALVGYAGMELYESMAVDPKYLAFVAAMSAIAAVSRAALQGIPGLQPATFFVILAGFCFGPFTGLSVGAFTALASNLFLGEGGWTPWQMLAWGLAGFTAGCLRQWLPQIRVRWLVPFGFVWGYVFGWIMNTWLFLGDGVLRWDAFAALCLASVWFDTIHAVSTALFLLIAGPAVVQILDRFRRKLRVSRGEPVDG